MGYSRVKLIKTTLSVLSPAHQMLLKSEKLFYVINFQSQGPLNLISGIFTRHVYTYSLKIIFK